MNSPARDYKSLPVSQTSNQALENQAQQLIINALERTNSHQLSQSQSSIKSPSESTKNGGGGFGKSLSSMMGLSNLSLTRTATRESTSDDKDNRGRSMLKLGRMRSASQAPGDARDDSRSQSRARSQSPFTLRRFRTRDPSPTPQPVRMSQSDVDLSDTSSAILPQSTAFTDDDSPDEGAYAETEEESSDEDDTFDPITEANTERNALITPVATEGSGPGLEIEDPDPVGEGVNVIIAPEPYFPSSLNALGTTARGKRNPRRRKSVRTHEPLPFTTSRPVFQRDRCTITLKQGNPEATLGERRKRRYVVASDLSEESRYAVEWGIGTVLRDGDEMLIVTVVENESKVDPALPNASDRAVKLRSQQERQGLAYILVRQVTGLLQRTKLNVTISCQAWHAKNSRHMLLDIVDHVEPTMLIVGSRGLGQLNGILLGSTSHYLIQKCSVPVMVARRRLKRPPRKNAHLSTHRTHVSLAEAGIDRVAAKVDQDVQVMRDELQAEEERREGGGPGSRKEGRFGTVPENEAPEEEDGEDENENEGDDEPVGVKVAG
ncbi:hypothetical protein BDN70DRAFT_876639 [Pholiota conissans]|uniref:UspA domain-containing protein n=1 Tax=Pholiota conissans TaxID=109636 RepID=A0A9P5Z6U1_9AGAR|nr:hypothetical protein BDN70DRAFT_876639 [Pholiota conissans]